MQQVDCQSCNIRKPPGNPHGGFLKESLKGWNLRFSLFFQKTPMGVFLLLNTLLGNSENRRFQPFRLLFQETPMEPPQGLPGGFHMLQLRRSTCYFWYLKFFLKTKEKIQPIYYGTSGRIVFVHFLEELRIPKSTCEINRP